MSKRCLFVTMCALAAGTTGCNKKAPAAGAGSAAGSAVAPVAKVKLDDTPPPAGSAGTVGGGKCASATAYQSPAGKFCIEPHGFTPQEASADQFNARVSFQRPIPNSNMHDAFTVSVSLQDEGHTNYDSMTLGITDRGKDPKKVISKGDLTDVTGKFLVENIGDHAAESLQVIVKSKMHAYACGGENYSPTVPADILAACKSIRPTE